MSNWIETTFNVSGGVTQAIAVIMALAVVLLLFGLFIFILKRLMGASAPQNRARQPRIAVMDSAQVDARRRLVLIRRDNIEHLLLIGGPSDVVVEQHIIRNAPLAQQISPSRPGAQAAPPMPGHAPVKPAMAPGPEIPPTPEDIAAQHEPAPPAPSVQARTPVQPAAPVAAPIAAPARSPAPPHGTPSLSTPAAAVSATADASAARSPSARLPDPAPRAPTVNAAPVSAPTLGAGAASAAAPEPGRGLNRAADLLRAATQNGFNRGTLRPQPPLDGRSGGTEPETPAVEATVRAPDVRAPAAVMPEAEESRTASTFKSLTRPFTARDRPSYGGSISPPASGPAARAKTVLAKPVEPVAPASHRIEPVVASAAQIAVSQSPEPKEVPEADVAGSLLRPETAAATEKPASAMPATETTVSKPEPETVEAEKAATETPVSVSADSGPAARSAPGAPDAADASDISRSPEAETRPETGADDARAATPDDDGTAKESAASTTATGQPAGAASVAREISLDLGDLLEDPPMQETKDQPAAAEASEPVSAREPGDEAADQAGPDEEETAPAAQPVSAAPAVRPPDPARPAPKPGAGLGDRNPIEEEMAKILDELGGQSNR